MEKVVVIGASGGIGHSVAKLLLDKGFFVLGTYYKNPQRLEDLTSNFKSKYLDLQNTKSIASFFKEIDGEVFAVVNCQGIVEIEGKTLEKDFEIWNKTIATNLTANFYLGKISKGKISPNGRFIMISSTDSFFGGAVTASYAASKAGVNSLTKSLSLEFADKKIRVNSIAPGWVETAMTEDNGEEFLKKIAQMNPLKRNGQPIDVAYLVEFLLSNKSEYINGQVITLDGGYTNQDPTLLIEESL